MIFSLIFGLTPSGRFLRDKKLALTGLFMLKIVTLKTSLV